MKITLISVFCLILSSCGPFDLTVGQCGPELACTTDDAQMNGWDINNVLLLSGYKVKCDNHLCGVRTCEPKYSLNIANKSCLPIICTLTNSIGNGLTSITGVSTVSGNLVSGCLISVCDSGYNLNTTTNTCDTVACTPVNALSFGVSSLAGITGISGNLSSGCTITSCDPKYSLNVINGSCDPVACTLANSVGNGVVDITNVASVIGDLANGCQILTCTVGVNNLVSCN